MPLLENVLRRPSHQTPPAMLWPVTRQEVWGPVAPAAPLQGGFAVGYTHRLHTRLVYLPRETRGAPGNKMALQRANACKTECHLLVGIGTATTTKLIPPESSGSRCVRAPAFAYLMGVGDRVLFLSFFSVHFLQSKKVASCAFVLISIALSQANSDRIVLLILELHIYRIGFIYSFGSGTMFLVMVSDSTILGVC